MYSVFLPFGAIVVDLAVSYIYFKHDWWLGGGTTALIAIIPLIITASLLYSGWSRLKQATVFLGFLHSGTQLLFQVTLLFKHWGEFGEVIIEYGTFKSPQYSIVLVSCIYSSLVVSKSARECHFLCQVPRKNHVLASHFRATPFFLLHTVYRSVSLALIAAFLPIWSWYIIIGIVILTNFLVTVKIFRLPLLFSSLTSFTAVLTPSLYPSDTPVHIATIANFHIINSLTTSIILTISALIHNVSIDLQYEWARQFTNHTFPSPSPAPHPKLDPISGPCTLLSGDCSQPLQPDLPPLPFLLQFGLLPPVLVASVIYVIIVIIVMGLIRPGFLELPDSKLESSSHNSSPEECLLNKPVDVRARVRSISMAEKGEYIRQDSSFLATLPVIASCHDSDESTNNYMVQEGQRDSSSPDTMTTIGVEEIVRMEEEEEDIVLLEEGIKTVIQNSDNVIGNYRFSLIESVPETEI